MSSEPVYIAPARVGRPFTMSLAERRRRILAAAEDLFGARGYSDVSMADIARRAEMSKKTLYEVFGSKEDLFVAMLEDVDAMPALVPPAAGTDAGTAIITTLTAIARCVLSDRHILVNRLVIAESGAHPELALRFSAVRLEKGKRAVVDLVRRLAGEGEIEPRVAERMAEALFGGTVGMALLTALTSRQPPDLARVEERIVALVTLMQASPRAWLSPMLPP